MHNTANGHGVSADHASGLEGRMLVLEIIAMTSLALLLDTSEEAVAKRGSAVLDLIRETVRNRCIEMSLPEPAAALAHSYADELMSTAFRSLFDTEH